MGREAIRPPYPHEGLRRGDQQSEYLLGELMRDRRIMVRQLWPGQRFVLL